MVAMANLQYPIATLISHRAQNLPNKPIIHCSNPVSSTPSKLTKRKNYLRQKILKTLTKPHSTPLSPPNPEDPVNPIEPIEPRIEVASEPGSDKQPHLSFAEESERLNLDQFRVVEGLESQEVKSFSSVFSGRMVVRIIASFVGLFVIQTVVSVWVMGSGDSDEKERNVGVGNQHRDLNGNAYLGKWGFQNVGELEMEGKIAEIRKMAREAREIEQKEGLRSGEEDVIDVIDGGDGDGDGDLEVDKPKVQSGIVKEVDKRLTKLRKRSLTPMLNVNYMNVVGDTKKDGGNKGEDHKGEDDMLMFEIKRKFRSQSTTTMRDEPKGFQTLEGDHGAREKSMDMDDEQPIQEMAGDVDVNDSSSANDNRRINGHGKGFLRRNDIDSPTDEKKLKPESSGPLKASKKGFGSNGATKKLNKQRTSSKKSGKKSATKELNKRRANPPTWGGKVDYSHVNPVDNGSIIKDSDKLGTKLSMSRDDSWWFNLPYVLVILMQTGPDSEGQHGFYTVRVYSDAKNQSYTPYIVGFEDRSDARNFGYLLELAFEDLPDAAIDVVPLSAKELKEAMELLKKKVIVVKKGQLHLYAGQPLDEVESALRSLVK